VEARQQLIDAGRQTVENKHIFLFLSRADRPGQGMDICGKSPQFRKLRNIVKFRNKN
jgi:hypothetical protein